MTAILSLLAPPAGARKQAKRLGRGIGTGLGKTAGRGQKGQKARSTGNIGKKHFQGGQTPMQRRLPKRGFHNSFAIPVVAINVGDLDRFPSGTKVDEALLRVTRLVQGRDVQIKILGVGTVSKPLTVEANRFSASAVAKIEAAGGKVVVLATTEPSEQQVG
jgi:large subunit ribosomal protein L15